MRHPVQMDSSSWSAEDEAYFRKDHEHACTLGKFYAPVLGSAMLTAASLWNNDSLSDIQFTCYRDLTHAVYASAMDWAYVCIRIRSRETRLTRKHTKLCCYATDDDLERYMPISCEVRTVYATCLYKGIRVPAELRISDIDAPVVTIAIRKSDDTIEYSRTEFVNVRNTCGVIRAVADHGLVHLPRCLRGIVSEYLFGFSTAFAKCIELPHYTILPNAK